MNKNPNAVNFDPVWVRVLRDAAPYILAHRDSTAVIVLPGKLLEKPQLHAWLGDITLLKRVAGLRFAIAYDVLPKATKIAADNGNPEACFSAGKISVSKQQMAYLRKAAHETRDYLESCLARGAPGHLPGVDTATGNLHAAHTAGIVNGKDLGLMGVVKKISSATARSLISTDKIVILPPLGVAAHDQVVHLDSTEVALEFAVAVNADKLIILTDSVIFADLGFRELTFAGAEQKLADGRWTDSTAELLRTSIAALSRGVSRVHILNVDLPGSMLLELLSPDGAAAMISHDRFDAVRKATPEDAAGIVELIAPSVAAGAMLERDLNEVINDIDSFAVVARDDALIACGCLVRHGNSAELGCLAVRPDYANQAYGKLLVEFFEATASQQGITELLAITTQAVDWFGELGYKPMSGDTLPAQRLASIQDRNARILGKCLV